MSAGSHCTDSGPIGIVVPVFRELSDIAYLWTTPHAIDGARLAQMKPGACLVNISRADLVDRAALIEALKSGRLGGFALDPLYEAPGRSDDELLGFRNVVLSPHIAAQPRFNALNDISDMLAALAKDVAP